MEFVIYSVHAVDVYLCILQWQLKLAPFLFRNRQGAVWSQDIKGIKLILKEFQGSEGVSGEGGHSTGPKSSLAKGPPDPGNKNLQGISEKDVWQWCVHPEGWTSTWTLTK